MVMIIMSEIQITILFEGYDVGLKTSGFFDPVDLFSQLIDDDVTIVNITPYQQNLYHQWHDSYGKNWLNLVRKHQDKKCYIVSDIEGTFDYGLVWV